MEDKEGSTQAQAHQEAQQESLSPADKLLPFCVDTQPEPSFDEETQESLPECEDLASIYNRSLPNVKTEERQSSEKQLYSICQPSEVGLESLGGVESGRCGQDQHDPEKRGRKRKRKRTSWSPWVILSI